MRAVCVYCGSSFGIDPAYLEVTQELGRALAGAGITTVYGGAAVGLMGALADAALAAGGTAAGGTPRHLADGETPPPEPREPPVVKSMHGRRALRAALPEAFAAPPGGTGPLGELMGVYPGPQ